MCVTSPKMLTSRDVGQVLVWWRDVGQSRFPHIDVMDRQFLSIPATSAKLNVCLVLQVDTGLTLSDLRKSLLEGTL